MHIAVLDFRNARVIVRKFDDMEDATDTEQVEIVLSRIEMEFNLSPDDYQYLVSGDGSINLDVSL